MSSLLDTLPTG